MPTAGVCLLSDGLSNWSTDVSDSMSPLSVGEFSRAIADLKTEMRDGFRRINGSLGHHRDAITAHTIKLASHDERLEQIDDRVGGIEERPTQPVAALVTTSAPKDSDTATFTLQVSKPMIGLIVAGFAGIQAALLGLGKLLGWLQ